jgi:3-oxoacyl-[acyl-carrier-protein] synthase-1
MIYLNALGMICSLGHTHAEIASRLRAGESGLSMTDRYSPGHPLPIGSIRLADDELSSVTHLSVQERSRNNRLALSALSQIRTATDTLIGQFGAHRIGVVLGTSTSGIAEGEAAFLHHAAHGYFPDQFHYGQQELGSLATAIAQTLGVSGPSYVHSSACSSSAKAMASAARLIRMGLCDAVITGGVDSLCTLTVAGFRSLESVSDSRCNPSSLHRNGINIGEGAALFLMSKEPAAVTLSGWGESSDAYHISAPDPQGAGAGQAIVQALARANIQAADIDYINLHGTATQQNDAMEANVIYTLFSAGVPASSTKGFTGHTLGAASAIEAGFCWLAMQDDNIEGWLPPQLWDGVHDPALPALSIAAVGAKLGRPPRYMLSNSFAFGGSNAALIFGKPR